MRDGEPYLYLFCPTCAATVAGWIDRIPADGRSWHTTPVAGTCGHRWIATSAAVQQGLVDFSQNAHSGPTMRQSGQ